MPKNKFALLLVIVLGILDFNHVLGQTTTVSLKYMGSIPKKECPIDRDGQRCARIIVEVPLHDVVISGALVKDFSGEEYVQRNGAYRFWVSVSDKKKTIKLKHQNLSINEFLLECDGNPLVPGEAYKIVIPMSSSINGTALFNIDEFVEHCVIDIDGRSIVSRDGTVKVNLPEGRYEYKARATGYYSKTGSITINGNQVSTIHITLTPSSKQTLGYIVNRTKQILQASSEYWPQDYENRMRVFGDLNSLPKQPFTYATPELKDVYVKYHKLMSDHDNWIHHKGELTNYFQSFSSIRFKSIDFESMSVVNVKGHYQHDYGISDPDHEDPFQEFNIILKWVDNDWYLDDALDDYYGSYKEAMIDMVERERISVKSKQERQSILDLPRLLNMFFSNQSSSAIIDFYKNKGFAYSKPGNNEYLYLNCELKRKKDIHVPVIADETTLYIRIEYNKLIVAIPSDIGDEEADQARLVNVLQSCGFYETARPQTQSYSYVHDYQNNKNQHIELDVMDCESLGCDYCTITLYR